MKNSEFMAKPSNLANRFEDVFHRLLFGENFDLYEEKVSLMFEVIAANLLADVPDREHCWYDGVVSLRANIKNARQVEFKGEMWVGNSGDGKKQWKENFRATVTDKRVTKQGIWIILWIGSDRAEGELLTAFGLQDDES